MSFTFARSHHSATLLCRVEPTAAVHVGTGGGGGGAGGFKGAGLFAVTAAVDGIGGLAEEAKSFVEVATGAGSLFGKATIGAAGVTGNVGVAVGTGALPWTAGDETELVRSGAAAGLGVVTTTADAGGVPLFTTVGVGMLV